MEVPIVILLLIVTQVFLQSDCENLQRTYRVLPTVTVFLQRGEGIKKEKKTILELVADIFGGTGRF